MASLIYIEADKGFRGTLNNRTFLEWVYLKKTIIYHLCDKVTDIYFKINYNLLILIKRTHYV